MENYFFFILILSVVATVCNGEGSISYDWTANVTVAQDGSGNYRTISDALNSVVDNSDFKFFIHVKAGVYTEHVVISEKKRNVVMFGDGSDKTVISGSLNRIDQPKMKTYQTATFSVLGDGFVGRDMKFVNDAGSKKEQAVAFHSKSNQSAMYKCVFDGNQDTLYVHAGQQLYQECDIIGTIDFIFGSGLAVFQNCSIQLRDPFPKPYDTVTAHAGLGHQEKSGFSIIGCSIMPFMGIPFTRGTAYLGRPWNGTATVVVMKTSIGKIIDPKGWVQWNSNTPTPPTVTFGEYQNSGEGSSVSQRVSWKGYNRQMTDQEALMYTIGVFINQNGWLKTTCVPFVIGL
ncbi:hypothetical protein AALP_AA3G151400 [Arabis alpina]|uniref:Pectinesterase n=1 Tax=Arabis alpina TaxID=50452 RepID=A0A087H9C0_ARAAL|nr:hypothetical protein AALP_AA3G151400 [Arabis alpina]